LEKIKGLYTFLGFIVATNSVILGTATAAMSRIVGVESDTGFSVGIVLYALQVCVNTVAICLAAISLWSREYEYIDIPTTFEGAIRDYNLGELESVLLPAEYYQRRQVSLMLKAHRRNRRTNLSRYRIGTQAMKATAVSVVPLAVFLLWGAGILLMQ